jgi:hypothetical protein
MTNRGVVNSRGVVEDMVMASSDRDVLTEAAGLLSYDRLTYQMGQLTQMKTDMLRATRGEPLAEARSVLLQRMSRNLILGDMITLSERDQESLSVSEGDIVHAGLLHVSQRLTAFKSSQRSVFVDDLSSEQIGEVFKTIARILPFLRSDVEKMVGPQHFCELVVRSNLILDNWFNPNKYPQGLFLPVEIGELGMVIDWHLKFMGVLQELYHVKICYRDCRSPLAEMAKTYQYNIVSTLLKPEQTRDIFHSAMTTSQPLASRGAKNRDVDVRVTDSQLSDNISYSKLLTRSAPHTPERSGPRELVPTGQQITPVSVTKESEKLNQSDKSPSRRNEGQLGGVLGCSDEDNSSITTTKTTEKKNNDNSSLSSSTKSSMDVNKIFAQLRVT